MTRILYTPPEPPTDDTTLLAAIQSTAATSRHGLTAATRLSQLLATTNPNEVRPQSPISNPPPTPYSLLPTPDSLDETDALTAATAITENLDLSDLHRLAAEQNRLADTIAEALALVETLVVPAPMTFPPTSPELSSSVRAPGLAPPVPGTPASLGPTPYSLLPTPIHTTVPAAIATRAAAVLAADPLFLDYETTGLRRSIQVHETPSGYTTTGNSKYHQVVEVAVIAADGRPVFHSWLDPQRPISDAISDTHGLAAAQLATAPTWPEVAPLLRRLLSGRTVVAHNAKFDALFTPPEWGITWVCTMDLANQAFGKYGYDEARLDWRKSGSLFNRLRQCGLSPGPAHTAAGDCLSTLRLLRYLAGYTQIV